jgi:hypothetical protein
MPGDNKLSEIVPNPQVMPMTEESLKAIPQRNPLSMDMFDYREPKRDAKWFKDKCEKLGMHLPDSCYEAMYMYETMGVRRKQYKSMLKKERRKQMTRIMNDTRILSF